VPEPTAAELAEGARKAFAEARRFGLTTIHDMLEGRAHLQAYETVRAEGGQTARVYGRWPIADWKWLADRVRRQGTGDDLLTLRSLKGFADGSIGSSTALFFEPYADDPANRGLPSDHKDELAEWGLAADAAGLQLSLHAIGDRAISDVLDLFERLERANGRRDRRPRVEHDQHTHPRDFARHAPLGAIASVQPYHAIDDGRWAEKRIGPERIKTTYAFRSLIDAGARLAFGSDAPVAPLDPILGIYGAVTRATLDDRNPGGWVPEEKITVDEALRAYTAANAWGMFWEQEVGVIKPGYQADLVVIDRDLKAIAPEEIRGAKVTATVVAGKVVFTR
jgi:hypothetical protein